MARRCFIGLLILTLVRPAGAQETEAEAPAVLSTAREAAQAAHLDAAALPAIDRPFVRYVWVQDRLPESAAAVNYSVNLAASSSRIIQRFPVLAGGLLVRLDLRLLDPSVNRLAGLWDRLADEPNFHVTGQGIARVEKVKVPSEPYLANDGKTYDWRWGTKTVFEREFALHAGVNDLLSLKTFTGTDAPIVEARYLLTKLLTTLDGGLYYEFRGIEKTPPDGKTALAAWLEEMGAPADILTSSDPRNQVAVFISDVTGKPRAVVMFFGTAARPTDTAPIVMITLDLADGDVDPKQHPVYTLLGAKFRASEAIGFAPNGLPTYALFNAAGELQTSVPDNIARDGTVPFPFTARLQPAIGCIRCHGEGEGWRTLRNDVGTLLASGLKPVDDTGASDSVTALDTILGRYTGDPDGPVQTLRNGHDKLAFQATGGLAPGKSASTVAAQVSRLFAEYNYVRIGPAEALAELGQGLEPGEDPAAAFARLVPKLPPLEETLLLPVEDPAIAALRAGIAILRQDFSRVYPDLALRLQAAENPKAR